MLSKAQAELLEKSHGCRRYPAAAVNARIAAVLEVQWRGGDRLQLNNSETSGQCGETGWG